MYTYISELRLAIVTQGTDGAASVVSIKPYRNGIQWETDFAVRLRVCDEDGWTDATNATIAGTAGYSSLVTTNTSTKDLDLKNQSGVKATETLTIASVVIDGETVTLGARVYEFDTDGSITAGNVSADISGGATAAVGILTLDTQVTATNTMTIGTRTWVFVPDGEDGSDGEISVGADLAEGEVHIVAALDGSDGFNTAATDVTVSDFANHVMTITAIVPGTLGDAIATTENFGAGGNIFDGTTLGSTTAGVDCIAATAVTALALAITTDTSALVGAVDGAGDTVVVTADATGIAANSYASTETMAQGSFTDTTMSGGIAELLGEIRVSLTDATQETVTLRCGKPAIFGLITEENAALANLEVTHGAA
jgi:hypothetical protein